ncbi:hypothetical protein CapIbe_002543 [Capra ibex]
MNYIILKLHSKAFCKSYSQTSCSVHSVVLENRSLHGTARPGPVLYLLSLTCYLPALTEASALGNLLSTHLITSLGARHPREPVARGPSLIRVSAASAQSTFAQRLKASNVRKNTE